MLAGVGVAVSDVWELKTGRRQQVGVDVRDAAACCAAPTTCRRRRATAASRCPRVRRCVKWPTITQPWPTQDGRWVLPHFNLPNLQPRVCGVLGCDPTPDLVARAVARWDALDLEEAIADARACGAMVRGNDEWLAHPHGRAVYALPLVQITRIGDATRNRSPPAARRWPASARWT